MRTVALVVAILLGIVAAIGVRSYLKRQELAYRSELKPVEVAVARQGIKAGEALSEEMVSFSEKPAKSLTNVDIGRLEIERYYGYRVNRNIDRGAPILKTHFVSREAKPASGVLREGWRAVTIGVDATSGVAGLIQSGDRVDIFATTTGKAKGAGSGGASPETWLVLSDVTVLALDDRMAETTPALSERAGYRRGYSGLTLTVTPLEAQLLIFLKDQSRLTFALRPRNELGQKEQLATMDGANVEALARQANERRQKEIKELQKLSPQP